MALRKEELEELLLGPKRRRRFTQDSPVYPDVWLAYRDRPPTHREDLLLEPHFRATVGELAEAVQERLAESLPEHRLAWAGEHVAVRLTLRELLWDVLPLCSWWRDLIRPQRGSVFEHLRAYVRGDKLEPEYGGEPHEVPRPADELEWWVQVAGRLLTNTSDDEAKGLDLRTLTGRVLDELNDPKDDIDPKLSVRPLWSVSHNREVKATLWRSRQTVKADAASRVFPADIEGLAWAVVDSGIDAKHPAFQRRNEKGALPRELPKDFTNHTIVRKTYDFTRLRDRMATTFAKNVRSGSKEKTTQGALRSGLAIDWTAYEPVLEIKHDDTYQGREPRDPHGTHVAGTIAGDWRPDDPGKPPRHELKGICSGLSLYDLRVLDENGEGYEFSVLTALSLVRWLNSQSGGTLIGVNLSFSLEHDVRNSACGRSPVCLECITPVSLWWRRRATRDAPTSTPKADQRVRGIGPSPSVTLATPRWRSRSVRLTASSRTRAASPTSQAAVRPATAAPSPISSPPRRLRDRLPMGSALRQARCAAHNLSVAALGRFAERPTIDSPQNHAAPLRRQRGTR